MIYFYRRRRCQSCRNLEDMLQELCLAHKVVPVSDPRQLPRTLPPWTRLPALDDNGRTISGQTAILRHLETLADFKAQWDKYQSDACYCDEPGEPE